MIKALRTPDDRFENLPGYSFTPHYISELPGYESLRLHYVDEGSKDAQHTFLCLHGEPTWSYLYRKMIPIFVQSGGRVIAPDLFGFGKSDKPIEDSVYTFDFHRTSLMEFIKKLDLTNITLVCQDWGGVLGLTIPMEMPERFKRLIVMNTGFGTGKVNEAFLKWRTFNQSRPDLNVGNLMQKWTGDLTSQEAAAYSAPFPSQDFKAGVRTFPNLVPDHADAPGAAISRKALDWWKSKWQGQSFMAIGMKDPILGPEVMRPMQLCIRGCPLAFEMENTGHFVQEHGEIVAKKALEAFA